MDQGETVDQVTSVDIGSAGVEGKEDVVSAINVSYPPLRRYETGMTVTQPRQR